jgi:hypothetical protein
LPRSGRSIFLQNFRAGNVAGHQVGSELNSGETQLKALRQRAHHQRFRQTRDALQNAMPSGEDADHQLFDDLILANDDLSDLLAKTLMGILQLTQLRQVGVYVSAHKASSR